MMDVTRWLGLKLRGGFRIAAIEVSTEPLTDAVGRDAVSQTTISGRDFRILIQPGLDESELSVTLCHEVLEAAAVGADECPQQVIEFNEGDFERAVQAAHQRLGSASASDLNRMLEEYGF
jgi:hypothetical protein